MLLNVSLLKLLKSLFLNSLKLLWWYGFFFKPCDLISPVTFCTTGRLSWSTPNFIVLEVTIVLCLVNFVRLRFLAHLEKLLVLSKVRICCAVAAIWVIGDDHVSLVNVESSLLSLLLSTSVKASPLISSWLFGESKHFKLEQSIQGTLSFIIALTNVGDAWMILCSFPGGFFNVLINFFYFSFFNWNFGNGNLWLFPFDTCNGIQESVA